jgi:LCP family protein required for cell wall assembly
VNILAIVNTRTKTVLLISTPRDYYVPFNFSPVNGRMDKLTHAGIYGIEASMRALGDYYDLPIHYYVRVNFTGFMNVIDTLGGVDVDSDADFSAGGNYYHKGMNHLNGKQALAFVRNRYAFLEGDRARGRHQMAVIKGVINGLMSSKVITNYAELLDEMEGCFQTNASKTMIGELVQLTLDRSRGDWKVLTYSVDGSGSTDYAYSLGAYAYCMVPYPQTLQYAQDLVKTVVAGDSLTQDDLQKNAPKFR